MLTRANAILIAIGLAALWITGLMSHATTWLTWLDGAAALVSFAIAGAVPAGAPVEGRSVPAMVVTLGLFALWLMGLVLAATPWLVWLTFLAGCGYAVVSFLPAGRALRPA